jgi:AmpD protein
MALHFDAQGWLIDGAEKIPSPHVDERPAGLAIDLLVIHNISLPAGRYGGGHIEALFRGDIDLQAHPSFADLQGLRVSSHFLIRRDGSMVQFVGLAQRAWHAGQSAFQGRTACNDFSVGIELEGCDAEGFTESQMVQLADLSAAIAKQLPSLRWVAGHSDIAPGRKTDPGPNFDWPDFLARLRGHGCHLARPFSDPA